ncbi:MAG: hypothetical protein HZA47_09380 [Planctomycetes bacterium]|uniref:hypothetical protein n=1 Tax=Candidatus Wunengus sp. YC65 TaxID=3367701 RepID=UPI001DCDF22B|nr:hypothetical protein [Planctomycetota bacterium]
MKLKFFALVIFLLFDIVATADAVPVMPNETVVRGRVEEYSLISSKLMGIKPEMTLYKLVISIEKVENVKGPNFLKDKEGQFVTLYTKEEISSDFYGKKIKAKIEYTGDERGGLFWIKQIEIVK